MNGATKSLLGIGIYTVADASRITHVPQNRIRRWLRGYDRRTPGGGKRRTPAVVLGQLAPLDGEFALGFKDLLEMMVINGFRRARIPWNDIRIAHRTTAEALGTDHPFCDLRIKTDGREIIADLSERTHKKLLLDAVKSQYAWKQMLGPYLHAALDFVGNDPSAWWPLGKRRRVVINPARMFGKPTVLEGVPTKALGRAYAAEHSYAKVAWWYEVSVRSVRDAVAYEQRLAA